MTARNYTASVVTNIVVLESGAPVRAFSVTRRKLIESQFTEDVLQGTPYDNRPTLGMNVNQAWAQYQARSWPYTVLLSVFAFTMACRMQVRGTFVPKGGFLRNLLQKSTYVDALWIGSVVVGLDLLTVWILVRSGYAAPGDALFWLRVICPILSLVVAGVLEVSWFRETLRVSEELVFPAERFGGAR